MKKEDGGSRNFLWIFETIFGSVQSLVGGLFGSVATGVEDMMNRIARRGFVFTLAVFGMWFLLNGFAKLLDFLYAAPGIGEMFIGMLVFSVAIVLSVLWKK